MLLYQVYAVMVGGSFAQEARTADHVQSGRGFKGAMDMEVFASILCLKEVGSQSAVGIRLSLKEVGICIDYQSS